MELHAKQCQVSDCPVPRCQALREMRQRQMSRQEERPASETGCCSFCGLQLDINASLNDSGSSIYASNVNWQLLCLS